MDSEILIYAKYDENNSIIDIRSNIFLKDTEGYTQIDKCQEGQDRYIYAHADNGEYVQMKYGNPLYDDLGRPNFHDDFVEWTEEEKKEKYPIQTYNPDENQEEQTEKEKQESMLESMMFASMKASFLNELPDEQAVTIPLMYDSWNSYIGKSMSTGVRFEYEGELWKSRQQISTVLENQPPSINTAALYERIDIAHAGTLEDPIPYDQTMTVYNGKYYIENDVIYKCIRDSGQPLYTSCSSLVGNYFEKI